MMYPIPPHSELHPPRCQSVYTGVFSFQHELPPFFPIGIPIGPIGKIPIGIFPIGILSEILIGIFPIGIPIGNFRKGNIHKEN